MSIGRLCGYSGTAVNVKMVRALIELTSERWSQAELSEPAHLMHVCWTALGCSIQLCDYILSVR
eukprot:1820865-Amphidinium_carterae.1